MCVGGGGTMRWLGVLCNLPSTRLIMVLILPGQPCTVHVWCIHNINRLEKLCQSN